MAKKIVPVKYTNRDFASIKADLVEYVKRYYPNQYKDFSEASFGSMMLDTVAYIGDQLSFYLDYQASEAFLDTAIEYDNVVRLGRAMGYKFRPAAASHGFVQLYIIVPAATTGLAPRSSYLPLLKRGSSFATDRGMKFTLTQDVDFSLPQHEIVVATVNSTTGLPTHYAVKANGKVISGDIARLKLTIGNYEKFRKVKIPGAGITEILSVTDSDGNEWFEVGYLSQDVVFRPIPNRNSDKETVSAILKPQPVPRRFVVEHERNNTYLQFGFGSDNQIKSQSIADVADVILDQHGRDYIVDESFDPSSLISTDKFGVSPSNTTLTVLYRVNNFTETNVTSNSIVQVSNPIFRFDNLSNLTLTEVRQIIGTLQVDNEEPIIGDISSPSSAELKRRIYDSYASQNRAVTKQDYEATIYRMPPEFGSVKRASVKQDKDSFKRNLNIYLVAEDASGKLTETNDTIKSNLKMWLSRYKMVNDTIDLLDGRIINLGIEFTVIGDANENRFDILTSAVNSIKNKLGVMPDFGEPFFISDIRDALSNADGVADIVKIKVVNKSGSPYSPISYDIRGNTSPDGRYVVFPESHIWEIRNFDTDIKGTVK